MSIETLIKYLSFSNIVIIMVTESKIIIRKLDLIKSELDSLKEHMLDITLTQEDIKSLEEAEKDLKVGKTKRLN